MTEQVKRYHKSFVGLMEQCNDGGWVRSKDFDLKQTEYLDNLQKADRRNTKLREQVAAAQAKFLEQKALAEEQTYKLCRALDSLLWYRCMMWFMIVVGVVTEVITRFIV